MPVLPVHLPRLLIRSTNWIGDAVMTIPAVRSIRRNYPESEITLLALPWVADVFSASPHVDRIVLYERQGRHQGLGGKWRLAAELRQEGYDGVILLQNAFEAALIGTLARIPVRAGYRTDGRGMLLTHGVRRDPAVLRCHQVRYYQQMLQGLGLSCGPDDLELSLSEQVMAWAARQLRQWNCPRPIIGLNPGAAYGPAKRWPREKYAHLATLLGQQTGGTIVVFGTRADREAGMVVEEAMQGSEARCLNLAGTTGLAEAMALIGNCDLFVTNDSGLMHVAAALGIPMVAIFGSTDHQATGPFCSCATVVRKPLACSPCKKTHCPENHFRCMEQISVEEVLDAGLRRLAHEEE